MESLQELIARGRFAFVDAPARLEAFTLVDGKRNTKEIASKASRHVNSVRRDLTTLDDVGLIAPKLLADGKPLTKGGFPVYEKVPLARAIPIRYFTAPAATASGGQPDRPGRARSNGTRRSKASRTLVVPTENEILAIANAGEDQVHEFKGQGVDVQKVTREVAGMLNTARGGLVLYGIEDDGTISGTDMSRQKFDQRLENSLRNTVSPAATIALRSVKVIGTEVLVVVVPPWNKRDVYQLDGRVHLRKGTNVFVARPEEVKLLHQGKAVV